MHPPISLAEHYTHLTDDEILKLATERPSLRPEAEEALCSELERRELSLPDAPPSPVNSVTKHNRRPLYTPGPGGLRSLLFWCGHSGIGAFGPTLAVSMFIYGVRASFFSLHLQEMVWLTYLALTVPFFPLQSLAALGCGFVAGRDQRPFWASGAARFAWIIPGVFLLISVLCYKPESVLTETRWQHFFWTSTFSSRLQQSRSTLPFLTSAFYSVGHFLGKLMQRMAEPVLETCL